MKDEATYKVRGRVVKPGERFFHNPEFRADFVSGDSTRIVVRDCIDGELVTFAWDARATVRDRDSGRVVRRGAWVLSREVAS